MISMLRGAGVAVALLLFAVPAAADPVLDFSGPPLSSESLTSEFLGDWATKTGTMTLDDMIVNSVTYLDGSYESLFFGGDDAALGAFVDITATFDGGVLDTSATNTIKIYDGTTVYFEATLMTGTISDTGFSTAFDINLHSFGGTTVDNSESDWFIENNYALSNSGILAFNFDGILAPNTTAGEGSDGVTSLYNLNGKLMPTPEPGTLALFGVAALGFAVVRRRRKAAA